jgi:hypothetical protein
VTAPYRRPPTVYRPFTAVYRRKHAVSFDFTAFIFLVETPFDNNFTLEKKKFVLKQFHIFLHIQIRL